MLLSACVSDEWVYRHMFELGTSTNTQDASARAVTSGAGVDGAVSGAGRGGGGSSGTAAGPAGGPGSARGRNRRQGRGRGRSLSCAAAASFLISEEDGEAAGCRLRGSQPAGRPAPGPQDSRMS